MGRMASTPATARRLWFVPPRLLARGHGGTDEALAAVGRSVTPVDFLIDGPGPTRPGGCIGVATSNHRTASPRLIPTVVVLCAILLRSGLAFAEQDQGTLVGRVLDPSGGGVPGAPVAVTSESGASVHTRTNGDGHYVLAPLVIGRYRITVEAAGFKRVVSELIEVHGGSRVRLDVELELGPVTDTISVRPPAPLLHTDTSSLTHTINTDGIGQLPVNGRNVAQLAMVAAGVLPAFGHVDRESGFNAHGQWAAQNNFILDGVDNNSHIAGVQDRKAQVLVPNLDAVQEVQVQTSNYTAEFGRGAGAVINVSLKSGSNALRGTAHEFLRTDAFDARDSFDYYDRSGDGKADPNALRQDQFGFTVGGPIRRNRTFYFGSVEFSRVNTAENRVDTVPSVLERRGSFDPRVVIIRDPLTGLPFPGNSIPADRWDPVAARMVGLWPEPNFSGGTRANYASSPAQVRRRAQYDVRVDHTVSSRDRMFVRGSWMDFRGVRHGPFAGPGVGGGNNDYARDDNGAFNLAVSETHVLGSALVHEARLGINSLTTDKQPLVSGYPNDEFGLHVASTEPIEGLARLNFGGALPYAPLGEFQFNPNDKTAGTLQILDSLSIAKGAHTVKVGADLRWIQSNVVGAQFSRGLFNFSGRFTGSTFADFLLGMTSSRQFSTPQRANLRERDYMFYVQDDWRVSPRVTFNLGLRYELTSPKFEARDRMSALDPAAYPGVRVLQAGETGRSWSARALVPTDTNNWAPRIGLAYQPAPLWTIRTAAGIFYGMPKGAGPAVHLLNNWPHNREVTAQSTATRSAGQLAAGINQELLGSATEMPANLAWSGWSSDFTLPTIVQWNISAQRQLGRSLVMTTAYVGSSSQHLQRLSNINAAGPGDAATERERRMIPSLGAITVTESPGTASYHGLQTTLDKRMSHGVQGSMSYTWSHSIDDVTELSGAEGNAVIQDWRDIRGDRGNSGFDRRHRLVAHALMELPFGAGRRWAGTGIVRTLLSGWQLSGIVSAQSGAWFDVAIVDPANRLGSTPGNTVWRPDLSSDAEAPRPTPDAWLNEAAFVVPRNADGTYRYGNLRRNSLLGPGYFNVDGGLTREIPLGGHRRLQVRWEVFNVTNHPSYGLPNSNLGSADFGTIRSTVSTPRQMQFGLKLLF